MHLRGSRVLGPPENSKLQQALGMSRVMDHGNLRVPSSPQMPPSSHKWKPVEPRLISRHDEFSPFVPQKSSPHHGYGRLFPGGFSKLLGWETTSRWITSKIHCLYTHQVGQLAVGWSDPFWFFHISGLLGDEYWIPRILRIQDSRTFFRDAKNLRAAVKFFKGQLSWVVYIQSMTCLVLKPPQKSHWGRTFRVLQRQHTARIQFDSPNKTVAMIQWPAYFVFNPQRGQLKDATIHRMTFGWFYWWVYEDWNL